MSRDYDFLKQKLMRGPHAHLLVHMCVVRYFLQLEARNTVQHHVLISCQASKEIRSPCSLCDSEVDSKYLYEGKLY